MTIQLFSTKSLIIGLTVLGGAGIPLQIILNTALKQKLGHPLLPTAASFVVGLIALIILIFVAKIRVAPGGIAQASWWMWLGGILGAFYVVTSIIAGHHLGAALAVALAISGQMIVGILLDVLPIPGLAQQPINIYRLFGVLLICSGAAFLAMGSVLKNQ